MLINNAIENWREARAADLRAWFAERKACEDALDWIDTLPADTPLRDVYGACPRGDWILWALQEAGIDLTPVMPAVYAAADRAVRQYAPPAFRAAGLDDEAAQLEALPEIFDSDSAGDAARAARSAAAAAYAARAAAAWAAAAAAYATAYAAAEAVAAWAAVEAARAARAAADRAADADARTAYADALAAEAADDASDAEHRRCADEIRALIPWEQAVEQMEEG